MDRFQWSDGIFLPQEELVLKQTGIHLYDGEAKTPFEGGEITLTNFSLRWRNIHEVTRCILLQHSFVILVEEEPTRFGKSPKIILHLTSAPTDKAPGPVQFSSKSFIKIGFRDGGRSDFLQKILSVISHRAWENMYVASPSLAGPGGARTPRSTKAGIVGIERNMQEKQKELDQSIAAAFADLQKLMGMAREMVDLSRSISSKIQETQGGISEDETVRFKSYLLSLGIDDPVTHETHGTGDTYHRQLAVQLATMLEKPVKEAGGMMALSDVYCRVNRARGLELLSPDDLVNACKMFDILGLSIRLHTFQSGVMVLQLSSFKNEQIVKDTEVIVEKYGCLTAEELSQVAGVPMVLALERLLLCESCGKVCRDDYVEGLRFYPNWFLTKTNETC